MMLPAERKQKTLDVLLADGKVGVADLAERFQVTRETIRRDLEKLEAEGVLERTHGGAIAIVKRSQDLPYLTREAFNRAAKQQIAHKAAQLIADGDAVMLDSSSTVCEMLGALEERGDLQLISNSLRLAAVGAESPHALITVGGELRKKSLSFVGGLAEESLARFNVDWALIGCKALHPEAGVLESNLGEAQIKRVMMAHARRKALLIDHTKFDRNALVQICGLSEVDVVVTDEAPSAAWIERLAELDIRLIY
ncbi:DeoR/GlpR family DNA-binding transcription regulator [Salinisphaera hydrothermalis]|uniref:DeoR family transcriptional regulator n=1 Tax=Salinisphaera hydrothermalis (strain C41B8) TaxID=1304275 RepID=A0A084IPS3_SALHC|nr:DeoR/GlpR family DNA-binding transcription regulator [Salinisphaera hydrothermalis]KEZ78707.1 DeoR family transcriptional regulator [Salinisphaera hydrothermalis C41B8]